MACILLGKVENVEKYLKESKKLIKEELMDLILFFFFWNLLFFFLIFIYLNIGVDLNYALYYKSRAMFD